VTVSFSARTVFQEIRITEIYENSKIDSVVEEIVITGGDGKTMQIECIIHLQVKDLHEVLGDAVNKTVRPVKAFSCLMRKDSKVHINNADLHFVNSSFPFYVITYKKYSVQELQILMISLSSGM
jgi:hypothetical protein